MQDKTEQSQQVIHSAEVWQPQNPYSNQTTLLRALLGQKILVIGHRGLGVSSVLNGQLPENTIPSLRMAFFDGADMVELDITLTWDSHVVVFHDDRLSRTTNGLGYIQNYTLETIRSFDAGEGTIWQGKSIRLPTLREVFYFILKEDMHHALNIELKSFDGSKRQKYDYRNLLLAKVIDLVQEFDVADRIIFSSFDLRMLRMLKKKQPQLICASLFGHKQKSLLHDDQREKKQLIDMSEMIAITRTLGFEGIHPHFSLLKNREEINFARQAGLFVQPYGLNTMDEFFRAKYLGVSGIITDYPERLRNFLTG